MELSDTQKKECDVARNTSGAFGAIGIAAVIQLLTLSSLSSCLAVALHCFAVSVPAHVYCFDLYTNPTQAAADSLWLSAISFIAYWISTIGISLIIFHMNIGAGTLFVLSAIAFSCHGFYTANRNES